MYAKILSPWNAHQISTLDWYYNLFWYPQRVSFDTIIHAELLTHAFTHVLDRPWTKPGFYVGQEELVLPACTVDKFFAKFLIFDTQNFAQK